MLITDLNDDELIIIFSYCTESDHKQLVRTCNLFEKLIEDNFFERKCRPFLMVSHMKAHPEVFERTLNGYMKYSERIKTHQNWMYGTCRQIVFFQHRENYESLLELDSNYLYTTALGQFNLFKRRRKDGIDTDPILSIGDKNDSKIASLKRRDYMIAGCRLSGTIFTYDEENEYNEEFVRDSIDPLLDLDFVGDFFVTTSRRDTIFHKLSCELGMYTFDFSKNLNIGFNSIDINPLCDKILGAKSDSLHIIEPVKALVSNSYLNRAQIYNTKWLNNNSFVFTSNTNPLCLIDTRDFKRQEFSCGNFSATSVDYDGNNGLIYGTLLGMIILCDIRMPRTFEKVFHLDTPAICRNVKSDERHLYISTDNAIHMLNFDY
ncbi:unnamed protein product [Chironomus riparius]|uniref:F-box domain-containing protein n=1 Tax=Chironomus riparius TaxID=315576 RepID=A0A9N9WVQ0_9DIPT|nr:unnamed protein product [Chironomus riparius]